jgi:OmcA/MtrC family decaheme c-type cytochrome
MPAEYGAANKVVSFSVDGSTKVERRKVVDIAKCDACHFSLSVHGENRNQIEMCVLCHNPSETDSSQRSNSQDPAIKNAPPQAVNFSLMVHSIHDGSALKAAGRPFVIVGFGGNPIDFSEVTFPAFSPSGQVGNVQACSLCHVDGSEANLPLELNNVTTPQGYENPTPPITAACMTCHASKSEFAHAVANTTEFGESCVVCHGPNGQFAADQVHAQ